MREVIVRSWCDAGADNGQSVPGEPFRASLGSSDRREVDLCPDHLEGLVGPLLAVLEAHGHAVDKRPGVSAGPDARVLSCPDCSKTYASTSGLLGHRRNAHGLPLHTGEALPCPDCGREFNGASGLGRHRSSAHGVESVTATARKLDDARRELRNVS